MSSCEPQEVLEKFHRISSPYKTIPQSHEKEQDISKSETPQVIQHACGLCGRVLRDGRLVIPADSFTCLQRGQAFRSDQTMCKELPQTEDKV